jgi:hypothetical protein
VAFVGAVTGLRNDGRTATFRVEEVWRGSVNETVVVRGGPPGNAMTSVDRFYEAGVRYLVVPYSATGDILRDNACSSTQVYTSKLDRFRPAGSSAPLPTAEPPSTSPAPADRPADGGGRLPAIALIIGAVAAAGSAVWFGAKWHRTRSAP